MELFNPNGKFNKALSEEVKSIVITDDFYQTENHLIQRTRSFGNVVSQLKVLEKLYQQAMSKIVKESLKK